VKPNPVLIILMLRGSYFIVILLSHNYSICQEEFYGVL
jgi:hypothetical protein